jgi:predicted porin
MKKSLIALAVLAASGASFAQSTVTVYGRADVWFGGLKDSKTSANTDSLTKLDSGGLGGSYWGLKGTEDLGGGLKAIFKLESGVAMDTGASSGFGRESWVGFSGGFGEVTLGNVYSATDGIMGASNSGFDSSLSSSKGVLAANDLYSGNPTSAIKYVSPNFSGFSVAVSYGLDENAAVNKDMMDIAASYGAGPLAINFAYQVQKEYVGSDSLKITTLNGSYDFGMAKLLASYAQSKVGDQDIKDYQIGVDVPLSAAMTLSAGYSRSNRNDAAFAGIASGTGALYAGSKNTGYGIAVAYSLSKRTTVYGGMTTATGENTAGADVSERELYAVGVRHLF